MMGRAQIALCTERFSHRGLAVQGFGFWRSLLGYVGGLGLHRVCKRCVRPTRTTPAFHAIFATGLQKQVMPDTLIPKSCILTNACVTKFL